MGKRNFESVQPNNGTQKTKQYNNKINALL